MCLAAEQQGLFKTIESMKLVRISEIDINPTKYLGVLKNNIQSDGGDFKDAPKPYTIWFDDVLEKCPKFVDKDAKKAKKTNVLSFIQSLQEDLNYQNSHKNMNNQVDSNKYDNSLSQNQYSQQVSKQHSQNLYDLNRQQNVFTEPIKDYLTNANTNL